MKNAVEARNAYGIRLAVAITLFMAGRLCAAGRSEVADAAMHGDKSALRTLLQQKVDVNAPQADGTTALHWAVRENDLEMTDMLLRAGAQPVGGESIRRNTDASCRAERKCRHHRAAHSGGC